MEISTIQADAHKNRYIFSFWVFTNRILSAIIHRVLALWCSRLARQPVTLEVDGSSPFGVAKKKRHPFGWRFFLFPRETRTHLDATVLWTVACEGLTEQLLNFIEFFGGAINSKLTTSPFEITFSSQRHTKSPDFRPGFHFTEYVLLPCNP